MHFAVIQLNIVRFAVNTEYSRVIVCMQDCHGWMHNKFYTVTSRRTCTLYITFCDVKSTNEHINRVYETGTNKKGFFIQLSFSMTAARAEGSSLTPVSTALEQAKL